MKQKVNLIGPLLQNFFVDFLVNHRRVSTQTLASYRDAFRLLLQIVRERKKIEPSAVRVSDLNVELVLSFLERLERDRENSIRSRNQRLAAIRAFFRLIALRDPESVNQAAQDAAFDRLKLRGNGSRIYADVTDQNRFLNYPRRFVASFRSLAHCP